MINDNYLENFFEKDMQFDKIKPKSIEKILNDSASEYEIG